MLQYYKKYMVLAYVIAVAIPLFVTTFSVVASGGNFDYSLMSFVSSFILLVVSTIVMLNLFGKRANLMTEQILNLYNVYCDPYSFLEKAAPVRANIKEPFDQSGAWFISYYALACADAGRIDEASQIGMSIQASAKAAKNDIQRAAILVSLEPVVLKLLGPAAAIPVIDEALEIYESTAVPSEQVKFLRQEKATCEARIAGDTEFLLKRYSDTWHNEELPYRPRVLYANLEAELHAAAGEVEKERECLEFVVEKGFHLPLVESAKARLAAL